MFTTLQESLNSAVMADMRSNRDEVKLAVLAVETVQRRSLFGYSGDKMLTFIKVTVALPRLIAPAKRLLEKESIFTALGPHHYQAYESNIDFDIRWVVGNMVVLSPPHNSMRHVVP